MNTASIVSLARAIKDNSQLEHLDISANSLFGPQLITFFKEVTTNNHLKSLNIAHNTGTDAKSKDSQGHSFSEVLANFLHLSRRLIHFDMSGLGLSFSSIIHIAKRGIRKSRTL